MRNLRWALLATAVLAYPAPALAGGGGGRPVVAPSSSQDLAETLETFLELPAPVNPRYGYGTDPCVKVGPDTLVAITFGEEVTCTAELGTVVRTGAMHFCSPWEGDPWYATNPRDGRRCARAASPEVGLTVSVDGAPPVDLFQPQYTAHTPPVQVSLPADNVFGLPPQRGAAYGFGWHGNIRNLGLGRHTYVTTVQVDGRTIPFPHVIHIVPRRSAE